MKLFASLYTTTKLFASLYTRLKIYEISRVNLHGISCMFMTNLAFTLCALESLKFTRFFLSVKFHQKLHGMLCNYILRNFQVSLTTEKLSFFEGYRATLTKLLSFL